MPVEFRKPTVGTSFHEFVPEPERAEPTFAQIAGAAWRTENDLYAAYEGIRRPDFEEDPNHNALDIVADTKYEANLDSFAGSRSEAETRFIMERIDREEKDLQTLGDSGFKGLVAGIASSVISPTMFMPGGQLYKGVRTGQVATKTALSTGVAAAAGAAVQEGVLQANQELRTAADSAVAIGGAAILGGFLGAGAGLLSQAERKALITKLDDFQDVMEAAEVEYSNVGNSSVGAAKADTRAAQLKDEAAIEKMGIVTLQDPTIRQKLSPSVTARRAINDLAENPLENAENIDFIASSKGGSVEARMKTWQGPLAQGVDTLSDNFSKYFFGREAGRVARATAPLRSEFSGSGKLSYHEFKVEVGKAMRRGDTHEIPEVEATARAFREQIFDPGKESAIKAGLFDENVDITTAQSYLTRVYNQELIEARRNDFKAILEKHFNVERARAQQQIDELTLKGEKLDDKLKEFADFSDQEVSALVEDTIDRLLGSAPGRMDFDITQGPRGPLRERVLNIPDEKIEDFLESDVEAIARQYTRTMSADVELTSKFGDPAMKTKLDEVREEYNGLIAKAKTEKKRIELQSKKKASIRDLEAVRDRLRGTFAIPQNPSGLLVRTGRVIRNLNYVRLLGGMTISAIPDMAKPIFVHGMGRTIQDGVLPIIKNVKAFKAGAEEIKLAGTALDMSLDTRALAIADLMDNYGKHSKFERGLSEVSSKFGLVSLMAPWNAFFKQMSGNIVMTRMLKAMTADTIDPKDVRLLAASGIDRELAERIAKQFKQHGQITDGIYQPNTLNWTDDEARRALRAALVRDVDRVVVTPGQDKPLWMSTELGGLIGQFKSFGVASIQRTLLAGIQQRDAATYVGTAMMLMLGSVTYTLKEMVAGREPSTDPSVLVANGLDRSGLLGWLTDANNILEKGTRGRVGLSAITGEPISRYQSRNIYGAFLGPTADAVADVFQISGAAFADDFKESDLRKARRLLPFQNLFYLRWLFNEVEQSTAKGAGLI